MRQGVVASVGVNATTGQDAASAPLTTTRRAEPSNVTATCDHSPSGSGVGVMATVPSLEPACESAHTQRQRTCATNAIGLGTSTRTGGTLLSSMPEKSSAANTVNGGLTPTTQL